MAEESRQPPEEQYWEEQPSPSDLDAMGLDKRRQVVGGQYGATVRKQLTVYGLFTAFVIGLAIAFLTVVSGVDNREIELENTAPWAQSAAPQEAPRDIDFPANGPVDTIPVDEIGDAVGSQDGRGNG
jgi:hypothetical protein